MASRIEQLNKTYKTQLLFSREVLEQAEGVRNDHVKVDKLKLKGLDEEVELYTIKEDE